jgi:hypothetical protein
MADKSFDPFTTKSFSSEHMYKDIFPIPSHTIWWQQLHHYTLPPHFQRNFLREAVRNSIAITTIINATLFSGAITSTQCPPLCILKLETLWMDFNEIWYWRILWKLSDCITVHWDQKILMHISVCQHTHILCCTWSDPSHSQLQHFCQEVEKNTKNPEHQICRGANVPQQVYHMSFLTSINKQPSSHTTWASFHYVL